MVVALSGCLVLVTCGAFGIATSVPQAEAATNPVASAISAGYEHNCALVSGGAVSCWGDNYYGELGDGSETDSHIPVAVSGLSGVIAVSAGGYYDGLHTCALISGGAVKCWGDNRLGELGDGTTAHSLTPVAVSGLTGATAVSAGAAHTCALISGGTVKCWGANGSGQLGDGTTTRSLTPLTVSGLTGAIAISAGYGYTCALISGGTVKCWGANYFGQLGDGTTTDSPTPVAVSGLTGATAISAGNSYEAGHTCALISGGAIKCWGDNQYGQLGVSTYTVVTHKPVTVTGLTGAIAVSAGYLHTCALISGGTMECWGNGQDGQLGDGTTIGSSTPVTVSGLTAATAISAGGWHTCALVSGGSVRCWGLNQYGQLGNGTTTDSSTPVGVVGLGHITPALAVFGLASSAVAGVTHSVTVQAKDASGNTATGYQGTVHFTSSDAKAVLPANYTFTAADAGTHTFSVTLKTAGTQSVTVTDTKTPSIKGSQAGIVVKAAAVKTLVVSGMTTPRTAGSAGSIRVTAVDAYGNRVSSYRGTVHFTSSATKAVLPADYKFTASDAGTHVFAVTLKTAGTQSVTASDTVTKTIKGSQTGIVVKAAALKALSVSGLATPRKKGVAGSIRVTAVDAYGNRVSSYVGTIHFTSSDTSAKLPANYTFKSTDAGTHVFTVTLKKAGTEWVRATDTKTKTITGTQTGIVVK